MSGTAGMLVALANFNIKNTTTYYPELYRIKMLILNANKFVATPVTCTYTAGTVNTDFINILYNLTILFPGIYIYYNRSSTTYKFSLNDFFQTTNNTSYTVFISQSTLTNAINGISSAITDTISLTGTFSFSYIPPVSGATLLTISTVPFIGINSVVSCTSVSTALSTLPNSPISTITSVTPVIVTVTVTYISIPTADFGISFNASAFKTWLVAANYTSALTLLTISNVPLSTIGSQFAGITSAGFAIATTAIPIIRQGTSLANCFNGCTYFNSNISGWDTSNVTSMANCFNGCGNYNNNSVALTWNTSKVNDMSSMFYNAKVFNQAITYNAVSQYWNTSAVTTIANIFACTGACAFANGTSAVPMLWILTGLSGQPLTAIMVTTTTTSAIYNWRGTSYIAPLTYANAPAALTTGPNTGFL